MKPEAFFVQGSPTVTSAVPNTTNQSTEQCLAAAAIRIEGFIFLPAHEHGIRCKQGLDTCYDVI
jgi:hypothetical protein